jgi:hypothetical protein
MILTEYYHTPNFIPKSPFSNRANQNVKQVIPHRQIPITHKTSNTTPSDTNNTQKK